MEVNKKQLQTKGKTTVNITKKKSVTIDKHGHILDVTDNSATSKEEIKKARAKKLGFE